MRGGAQTVKERLDIVEVISGYLQLQKAGINLKARCPFHSEKTPSFFVSPSRQSFTCFGCGKKGDVFTFVEEMEGLDFSSTLKILADKAGVELEYEKGDGKQDKDEILDVLEAATKFFEGELAKNASAREYLASRGLSPEMVKRWRLGLALDEWRVLYSYLKSVGFSKELILKAGLIKSGDASKEPYDVFRGRVVFPLMDASGKTIAFSGRALAKDAIPKYLNSPDTIVFRKSEVLYGLDKAKETIRSKDYSVLVEGQMDLLMSHQAGVGNTVASSGTAFTSQHLERLKRLSARIILAFDGDSAGEQAGEKSTLLALSLGLEVKIARLPQGSDPAELSREPEKWREVLRGALPAVEHFLRVSIEREKDTRKLGRIISQRILPMIALMKSTIEQSHFVSLVTQRTGIKESVIWDDLKKVKISNTPSAEIRTMGATAKDQRPRMEQLRERLLEIAKWRDELKSGDEHTELLDKEERELKAGMERELLKDELADLSMRLRERELAKDSHGVEDLTLEIGRVHKKMLTLEENVKIS